MGIARRITVGLSLLLGIGVSTAAGQAHSVRPYVHGGIGLGRFVFLCNGCGPDRTSVVPSASVGLSLTRIGLDVGLDALNWSNIGDRYTVLTASTTLRPRHIPLFFGVGVGLALRQYPQVCNLCSGTNGSGTLAPSRASTTDPAAMVQIGGRLALNRRVGLEPFAQYSRLAAGSFSVGHADHLAVGVRFDGR